MDRAMPHATLRKNLLQHQLQHQNQSQLHQSQLHQKKTIRKMNQKIMVPQIKTLRNHHLNATLKNHAKQTLNVSKDKRTHWITHGMLIVENNMRMHASQLLNMHSSGENS